MAITHHLDDATLMSFAAGSLPEALSAVALAHICACARCAAEVRRMERIGAALFADLAPHPLTRPTPVFALRRMEADADVVVASAPHPVPPGAGAGEVPAALVPIIGHSLDEVAWKRLGVGLWHARLPVTGTAGGDLRLLKVGPGRRMPDHGHGGSELTYILRGCYRDEVGSFGVGDVADLDDSVEHRPVADAELGCICLIASERRAMFKGLFSRLLQPLTGI